MVNSEYVFRKKMVSLVFVLFCFLNDRVRRLMLRLIFKMKIPEKGRKDARCTAISLSQVCGY